jgi:hypothetical protein
MLPLVELYRQRDQHQSTYSDRVDHLIVLVVIIRGSIVVNHPSPRDSRLPPIDSGRTVGVFESSWRIVWISTWI